MEKKAVIAGVQKILLKVLNYSVITIILLNAMIILIFHTIVPFFPILFLFNFCFWIGHPLFVEYILKKKWFVCVKDDYLFLKYILIPSLLIETIVMLYYHELAAFIINAFMEDISWK